MKLYNLSDVPMSLRASKGDALTSRFEVYPAIAKCFETKPRVHISPSGDLFVLDQNWFDPGTLSLMGSALVTNQIRAIPFDLIRYFGSGKPDRNLILGSMEPLELPIPELDDVALPIGVNSVDVAGSMPFETWVRSKGRKHRKRIAQDLEEGSAYRFEHHRPFCTEFKILEDLQREHLANGPWTHYEPYARSFYRRLFFPLLETLCRVYLEAADCLVAYCGNTPAALILTITIAGRRHFILPMRSMEFKNSGMVALAQAMKEAVEDPAVDSFEMMSGGDYKSRYEPSERVAHDLMVFSEESDVGQVVKENVPPYFIGETLYRATPQNVDYFD